MSHNLASDRYLYTQKVNITSPSVQCLHWMASYFGAKQLMEDTGRLFAKVMPEDPSFQNQLSIYDYATEMGDLLLREDCVRYLAWNYPNLTTSPLWTQVSVQLLETLLLRADLVVPDEYFVLRSVENWIMEKSQSTRVETQAKLLSHVRFPMIPADRLHDLEASSPLYGAHQSLYKEKIMKALYFNLLLFSTFQASPAFDKDDPDYQTRIYTAEPWSAVIDPAVKPPVTVFHRSPGRRTSHSYFSYTVTVLLETPVHNSLVFQKDKVKWDAQLFRKQQDCSNEFLDCPSLPVARLKPQSHISAPKVAFQNRLLLVCQGKYICQVQDFNNSMSPLTVNSVYVVPYPCPGDQYTIRYVVRPQYV